MRNVNRKMAFVLASSNHGTMIVNRFDYHITGENTGHGVGHQIFEQSAYDPLEVELAITLLEFRRQFFGDGVMAIDCGANIGVHTVEWARAMAGWGSVVAIEAQERIYYALAGNIAINNCFNAIAINAAVSSESGMMRIPAPDHLVPSSFGSLELKAGPQNEFIGQTIDYSEDKSVPTRMINLDAMGFDRVDFIKLDIEGMELDALAGATTVLSTHRPIVLVESTKSDRAQVRSRLEGFGYKIIDAGINVLAVHKDDQTATHIVR
ncbi:MAG: FkbM family methyltransferase [Pseudolabrys sp.]|jgi:FkbM family methyltransferase